MGRPRLPSPRERSPPPSSVKGGRRYSQVRERASLLQVPRWAAPGARHPSPACAAGCGQTPSARVRSPAASPSSHCPPRSGRSFRTGATFPSPLVQPLPGGLLSGNRGSCFSWDRGGRAEFQTGSTAAHGVEVGKRKGRVRSVARRLRGTPEARFLRVRCACAVLRAAGMVGTPASSRSPPNAASSCALLGSRRAWPPG